jgi:deaminated glutathione amidase
MQLDGSTRFWRLKMPLRAALLQTCSGIDPLANATTVRAMAERAVADGAQLILTPEMTGLLDSNKTRFAASVQPEDSDATLAALRDLAAARGVWVLIGSLPIPLGNGRYANRAFLIDSSGDIRARYDKIHRFDVDLPNGERYRESATYDAGDQAVVATTPWGKLGLTICYDLRFPHLFRALAQAGAEMIAVPAAFTAVTGRAHWHVLLRARAIETGCFLLAPAQSGHHDDGRDTFGHSLAINPWGEVIADAGETLGPLLVDIDLGQIATARGRIPALQHDRTYTILSL